jgi:TonB family protein
VNKEKDSRIKGLIGTFLFHAILLIILLVVVLSREIPTEEEGLTVNFGVTKDGAGYFEPTAQRQIQEQLEELTPPPPTPSQPSVSQEALQTQNFEESLAMIEAKKKKEEEKRKIDEQKRIIAEQKRIEEEKKREEQRRLEEERKKQAEKVQRATSAGQSAFGSTGSNTANNSQSEGTGTGTGNQGNPFGEVDGAHRDGAGRGNNPSFSLSGRSILGKIPLPNYNNNEQGIIVVDIEVDKNGNVISARAGARGTTIGDISMRKEAEAAARRAKFNGISDNMNQTGTITYRYVLR